MDIQVVVANLVKQPDAQAVMNSANANLRLGSGVAGAIHTAAGDELEDFCEQYAPLALGMAGRWKKLGAALVEALRQNTAEQMP